VGRTLHTTSNFWEVGFGLPKAMKEDRKNKEKCEEIVKFLEIEHIKDAPVGKLSYGLQKKVEFGKPLRRKPVFSCSMNRWQA
jgi:branched-chain amino acid transport system ATP-binding protein